MGELVNISIGEVECAAEMRVRDVFGIDTSYTGYRVEGNVLFGHSFGDVAAASSMLSLQAD